MSGLYKVKEYLVQPVALVFKHLRDNLYPMLFKDFDTAPGDKRIRVIRAHIYSFYTGFYHCLHTWRLLAMMTAGLESHIHIRSLWRFLAML